MFRFLFLFFLSMPVMALDFGINIKTFNNNESRIFRIDDIISIMNRRNLKTVRVNIDSTSIGSGLEKSVEKVVQNGGTVEGILLTNLQYDNSCSTNLAAITTKYYNETYALVDKFKFYIYDYELLNESSMRSWLLSEVPQNTGELASAYTGKTCYATLIAGLTGMANAVNDIRTATGLPLRTILGVTGRDYGFAAYAIAQGVKVDVIGYHIYSTNAATVYSTDTFWGYGVNTLYTRLAQYNKPVRINEFNCGETFSSFDNVVDSTATINCSKAIKKHVTDMMAQTTFTLESITFYELQDEPGKPNPEDRFGLTYSIYTPKMQLATVSALAGGWVSASEKAKLISQGIFTCQEIVDYKNKAYYDPLKVTVPAVTTCN